MEVDWTGKLKTHKPTIQYCQKVRCESVDSDDDDENDDDV